MATADALNDPELLATEWDLRPLVDGNEETGAQRALEEALKRAHEFAATYDGKLAELDSVGLAAAMLQLAAISDLVGRAGSFASLRFATDSDDPARGVGSANDSAARIIQRVQTGRRIQVPRHVVVEHDEI